VYNIGAGTERANIEIANLILKELNKPASLIKFVEDRQGHDFRYSLNTEKIKKLGWAPRYKFENALGDTIKWYIENEWWWKTLVEVNK
jgi:dTDP-glucose 4,6-dehydratase